MPNTRQQPARILIIEDEPLIALDLQESLADAGFDVAGVAGRLQQALQLIAGTTFDAAVVDANLAGESAAPAAAALVERGVPFIVLSGYSLEQQQEQFGGTVFIQKPCQPDVLIGALRTILA
jgi:CheY-like chemotaxis protein